MPPDVISNSGDIAYLVHVFHRRSKGRDQIHAVGRMENGQTVGLVDQCARPVLYLRCEDAAVWEPVVRDGPCAVVDTALCTLSGDPVVRVQCDRVATQRRLAKALAARFGASFGALEAGAGRRSRLRRSFH